MLGLDDGWIRVCRRCRRRCGWWMMNSSDLGLPRSAQLNEHERQVDAYHRDDQIFVAKSHYALDMSRQKFELCCLHFLFRLYAYYSIASASYLDEQEKQVGTATAPALLSKAVCFIILSNVLYFDIFNKN